MRYVGDDFCLVSATVPVPHIYSLYNSAKLELTNLKRRFLELESLISNPDVAEDEKALIYCGQRYSKQIASGVPLRAILLPTVTGRSNTSVRPASLMAALRALAPSTLGQMPGAGQEELSAMSALARSVPSYYIEIGAELEQIPPVVRQLLGGVEP
jgi:hypothetical protein